MEKIRRWSEQGQSLVLFALSAVALIAFVGLAIDGGLAYSERREAQNAADSGAVAGTYSLRIQNRTGGGANVNQSVILGKIHTAVEAHDVPDTDPSQPSVNGNVTAYFTDQNGRLLPLNSAPCAIGSCNMSTIGSAWGVQVQVNKPFNTYFAGIIGWKNATVGANAISVTHAGASMNNERWAMFGMGARCTGTNTVKITGATGQVIGNVHSNGGVHQSGSNNQTYGTVTSVSGGASAINNLTYPSYDDFATLARQQATGTPGYYTTGINAGGSGGELHLGSVAQPFTYINGDLKIGTNWTVYVHGVIAVTGDVDIQGMMIPVAPTAPRPADSCGDPNAGSFTIVSGGSMDINNSGSNGGGGGNPYIDDRFPLLRNNVVKYLVNDTPNSCNSWAFKMSGSSNVVWGSVIAPNGQIQIAGSTNRVIGALIGDSIDVAGSSTQIHYNASCFPPQPDRIELLR